MSDPRGTFFARMDELSRLVGDGMIEGLVSVDQVYAHYQDSGEGPDGKPAELFEHPRGGEAGYLSGQIEARRSEVIQTWADDALSGDLVAVTVRIAQSFGEYVYLHAPREFWVLRNSVVIHVSDNRVPAFFQPPLIPRLSQAELDAIRAAAGGDAWHSTAEGQHLTSHSSLGYTTSTTLGRLRVTRS